MRVTKHYEHDHVMVYVEEGDTKTCITLESDCQIRRLGQCLIDLDRTGAKEVSILPKTFKEECKKGYFEFNPNRSFEERCEIARRTAITPDMTYDERLAMQKARYGL